MAYNEDQLRHPALGVTTDFLDFPWETAIVGLVGLRDVNYSNKSVYICSCYQLCYSRILTNTTVFCHFAVIVKYHVIRHVPTFCTNRASRTVLLSLWVETLWGLNDPFIWVAYEQWKTQVFTLQFIILAKLQLRSSNKKILCLGESPQLEELY